MEVSPGNSCWEQEKPPTRRGICKAERFQTVLATCRMTSRMRLKPDNGGVRDHTNWDSLDIHILALYLYFDPEYELEGFIGALSLFPHVSFLWFPVLIWLFLLAFEDGWPDQNWDRGYDSKFEGTRPNFGLPVTQNELTPGREERWTFSAVVGVVSSRTVFIFQVSLHYFLSPFGETKKELGTVFRIFKQVWPLVVPSRSLQALQSALQTLLPCFPFDPSEHLGVLLNYLGSCH